MSLNEKVTIITGAGNGIGATTALKFAKAGAYVVATDINQKDLDATCKMIQDVSKQKVLKIHSDVTVRESVTQLFDTVIDQFGRVDIAINNAGVVDDAQLTNMTDDQWDKVVNVDLKGVFIVGQVAAQHMKNQKSGVILNASSIVGLYGNFGQTNYAASKWGVIGMTKTWAKELGKYGIRVNAIAPGFTRTTMIDSLPDKVTKLMEEKSLLNKLGDPEDIANGYAFLASDEAKFITGTTLSIDGGLVI